MVWAVFVVKKQETQGNRMVWVGFFLSRVRKLKEIRWFRLFVVVKSQEAQGNRMVWGGFFLSRVRKLKEIK